MTTCQHCGAEMPGDLKFCRECGASMASVRSCPSCGAPDEGGRFCGNCGATLKPGTPSALRSPSNQVAERRVTSVLFGDLAGFTPLSESRDAEDVRELLSRYFGECRTIIGRYGGIVEKFIGDAVMAVWGVPLSHEDDAERAVRAGLELVESTKALGERVGVPGLAMRVGVVTGEVAVTVGATAEGMVAGDAVNTASRVQSVADPGSVWVDDTTRALTAAAVSYIDVGEHWLKGKSEPARLWQARAVVADLGGGQRVDGLEAPLVGREREVRLIKELFHATHESQRPRLVVLDGEPGVGKSRLAWEFEKYVDGLKAITRWHRGRCLSYGDGVAFWALAEALRPRLGLTESDAGDAVAAGLEASLAEFVPRLEERDWLRPRLAALVSGGQAGGFAREDLFTAWTAFLERISEDGNTVVLVIEDAHYADDGLLAFLDSMLANASAPIFVLALARPELLTRRPDLGGRRTSVVRLDPLDDATMSTLVDGLVDGLPVVARTALVERAEGIPLFAIETVRALIDQDAVVPRDGRYVPADGVTIDLASIGAPASLQALVAARLDALSPTERAVVADASVLGSSFTREGLLALGSDGDELDDALATLQRKEIIALQQDRFSADRGQYRFVQSVVRQVAYGTLSRRDRKARHLAAADFLSAQLDANDDLAVVVAQHLLDAVDAGSATDDDTPELLPRACALLERAGTRARALGSPAEARRRFDAALARATDPLTRASLYLAAAEAAYDSGDYEGAVAEAAAATDLFDALGRPIDAALAVATGSMGLQILGDFAGVVRIAEPRWQALDGVAGAERALLQLARPLANATGQLEDEAASGRYTQRRVLLAEAVGDAGALAEAMIQLGTHYHGIGGPATARALYEAAADISRANDVPGTLARSLINIGTVLMSRDLPAAIEALREARDVARRSGVVAMIEFAEGNYASTLWLAGRLNDSRTVAAEAAATAATPSMQSLLACIQANIADATGEPVPVPPHAAGTGGAWDRAGFGYLEMRRLLASGDAVAAAATTESTLVHVLAAGRLDDDFCWLWPPLVQAAVMAGDAPLATRLLEPVTTASEGIISAAVAAQFRYLLGSVGALRGDDPGQVEADLRAGTVALADFGAVGASARAEEELARWLIGQGRTQEAQPHIEHARAVYQDMGAVGWLHALDSQVSVTLAP